MKNICFYFTVLSKSKESLWGECFNELAHEMDCFSYVLFDVKNDFDIFSQLKLDKTYPKIVEIS